MRPTVSFAQSVRVRFAKTRTVPSIRTCNRVCRLMSRVIEGTIMFGRLPSPITRKTSDESANRPNSQVLLHAALW